MGLLRDAVRRPRALSPDDERIWSTWSPRTVSGARVNAETAMAVSTVYACVRIISNTVASLPLVLYRRRPDGVGKERATIQLANILRRRPNRWQTSFEWRSMMMVHLLLRGNAYSRKILNPDTGFVEQLIPIHPDRVTPELQRDGRILYWVRRDNNEAPEELRQEQVFHLRGLSSDGVKGMGVLETARETIGIALATERHQARVFGQGTMLRYALKHPGDLSKEAKGRLRADWRDIYSGPDSFDTAVLEEGMTLEQLGMTNEDAQFVQLRGLLTQDIARFFNMPLVLLQDHEKSTTWGTGVEQIMIGFVTHTIRPYLVNWEQSIDRDLIVTDDVFFAEFLIDALLRADTKTRYEAYQIAAGGNAPWMARNEIRALENLNPRPGLDDMLQPLNMSQAGAQQPGGATRAHLELLAMQSAGRLVRKEAAALRRLAVKHADDQMAFETAAGEFYVRHAGEIAESLGLDSASAAVYCAEHQEEIRTGGLAAAESAVQRWIDELAGMVLDKADSPGESRDEAIEEAA